MNAAERVVIHLNKLLEFLEPVHELANSHFGSIFSENLWNVNVPKKIQIELNNDNSINNFIQLYSRIMTGDCPVDFATKHPNLLLFLEKASKISLANDNSYSELSSTLQNSLMSKCCALDCDIKLKEFMSEKKLHEVKKTSKLTALLSNLTNSSHIVDVGGGKGYLSSVLALHYGFKVLGLDSSEITTCGASVRSEKVAKLWEGGIFYNGEISKEDKKELLKEYYKQAITFVNPQTDVASFLQKNFNDEVKEITLTGLHTCGDLATTCLKLFQNNKKIKAILNVGCCYNNLSEEFKDGEIKENFGFPMSSFLRQKRFGLGRNTRMLAAHSLDRLNAKSELDELSQTSLLYRAILETIIKKYYPNINYPQKSKVGRIGKKFKNFNEYMGRALQKLDLNIKMSDAEFQEIYDFYQSKKPILTAFFLLRVTLAPVIESIILLDRILYLMENGINNAYLIRLFDLEISPRGFAIVAWKDPDNC